MKTYYVTSLDVLTEGILEVQGRVSDAAPNVLIVEDEAFVERRGARSIGPRGRGWHETRAAAVAYANEQLRLELLWAEEDQKDIEARLARLRSLKF